MNSLEIRQALLNSPSREFLIEIINASQLDNPVLKSLVFMAVQSASQADIEHFSKIAAIVLQYAEQGNTEGLRNILARTGVPGPIAKVIEGYASNFTSNQ